MTKQRTDKEPAFAPECRTCFLIWLGWAFVLFSLGTKLWNVDVLDETGTMSVSAFLAGEDWSLANFGMGSFYYKYFQSLFYVPFFLWIRHPFTRYKAIMAFHALVMALIPVCVYHVSRKFFQLEKRVSLLFMGAVGSVPSVILYSFYARADVFLSVLPWILLVILLESARAQEESRKTKYVLLSILAAGTAVASYASHTRGIIMVIASFLTILLVWSVTGKAIAAPLPYLGSTIVFLGIDRILTRYFKANVWPYGVRHASMKTTDWSALKQIFTKDGFLALLKICTGWYFNATAATFGLAVLAVAAGVLIWVKLLAERCCGKPMAAGRDYTIPELVLVCFGTLEFLGTAAMGIIFFYPKAGKLFLGTSATRGDRAVYGRYMAAAYGLLVLIALYTLLVKKAWLSEKTKIIVFAAHVLLFGFFAVKVAPVTGTATMSIRNLVSLCRFLPMSGFGYINGHFYRMPFALICMGLYTLAVFAVILLLSRKKSRKAGLAILALFFLLNAENLGSSYLKLRYNVDMGLSQTTVPLFTAMRGFSELSGELKNVYVDDGISLKEAQMVLADFRCVNKKAWKKWKAQDTRGEMLYILPQQEEAVSEKLKKKDWYYVTSFRTGTAEYGVYAVGDQMCQELKGLGYDPVPKLVSPAD